MTEAGKPHIVFVDDEPGILSGLRRGLFDHSDQWDMSFFPSARAALAQLSARRVDVVVSDMRMPEIDGEAFLGEVASRYPHTVRIILSGYTDREAVARSLGPAHRWLSKPCPPALLSATIQRSLALRQLLASEPLQAMVAGMKALPSRPQLFHDLLAELDDPKGALQPVVVRIQSDLALTAQLLKLVNSGYFSLAETVTEVDKAVRLVGIDTVRLLVLHASILAQFAGQGEIGPLLEQVSAHGLKNAALARRIAIHEGFEAMAADEIACANLLSHLGTILLAANYHGAYREAIALVEDDGLAIDQAEHRLFQADHGQLGAYLLGLWGFSDAIVEAVAYHHRPAASGSLILDSVAITHVAQTLGRAEHRPDYVDGPLMVDLDMVYLADIGGLAHLGQWIELFQALRRTW